MGLKETFSEEEQKFAKWVIYDTGKWSERQVRKAAEGIACGACAEDPWPVRLKTWIELERSRDLSPEEFVEYLDNLWLCIVTGNQQTFSSMVLSEECCSKEDVSFYESL